MNWPTVLNWQLAIDIGIWLALILLAVLVGFLLRWYRISKSRKPRKYYADAGRNVFQDEYEFGDEESPEDKKNL